MGFRLFSLFCICRHDETMHCNMMRCQIQYHLTTFCCIMAVPDLIFLQGKEVVLKMGLVLLANHKELIKQCIGFESIVEFLKTTLPEMGIIQLERVINEVGPFLCNLSSDLVFKKQITFLNHMCSWHHADDHFCSCELF